MKHKKFALKIYMKTLENVETLIGTFWENQIKIQNFQWIFKNMIGFVKLLRKYKENFYLRFSKSIITRIYIYINCI